MVQRPERTALQDSAASSSDDGHQRKDGSNAAQPDPSVEDAPKDTENACRLNRVGQEAAIDVWGSGWRHSHAPSSRRFCAFRQWTFVSRERRAYCGLGNVVDQTTVRPCVGMPIAVSPLSLDLKTMKSMKRSVY